MVFNISLGWARALECNNGMEQNNRQITSREPQERTFNQGEVPGTRYQVTIDSCMPLKQETGTRYRFSDKVPSRYMVPGTLVDYQYTA